MIQFTIENEVLNPVNPLLFGQFMEKASFGEPGPEICVDKISGNMPKNVTDKLESMQIPLIRFPGGTDIGHTDWRDLINNVPGRGTNRADVIYVGEKTIGSRYGFEEYFSFAKQIQCESLFVVNLFDALMKKRSLDEAAQIAAGQVAYCNAKLGQKLPEGMPDWAAVRALNGSPEPHTVKYFQIGNETWIYYKRWAEEHFKDDPQGATEWYKTCLITYADLMKQVDPSIQLITERYMGGGMENVLLNDPEIQKRFDFITVHRYGPWGIYHVKRDDADIDPSSLTYADWFNALAATPAQYNAAGEALALSEKDLIFADQYKYVSTEWNWNGWYGAKEIKKAVPFDVRMPQAVGAASVIHGMIRQGHLLEMATQSMLVGSNWGITSVRVDPSGEEEPVYLPQGMVSKFYNLKHGVERIAVQSEGIPSYTQPYTMQSASRADKILYVDCVATQDEKSIYVHLINRDYATHYPIQIQLDKTLGITVDGTLHTLRTNASRVDKMDETTYTTSKPISVRENQVEFTLMANSVSIIELPRHTYSAFSDK